MSNAIQEERWADIPDFPGYCISDWGRVLKKKSGLCVRPSAKTHGYHMVGLMREGVQCKRSLPLLVAREFLLPPHLENFDTPIHLDGDRANSYYWNLMWRPLWYSRKYMKQFADNHTTFDDAVEDVESGELYKNSMHAATVNGVLDSEIYLAMLNNDRVWPTGQIFRKAIKS